MRLLAIVLAVAGLVLGFGLSLVGIASWLPLLAAVCFFAAGCFAAGAVRRRGGWLVLAGVVAAAVVIALPVVLNTVGNGRGIAWSVPERENVEFAEAGMAVTAMDESTVLTGRDLGNGERRWRVDLGDPTDPTGQLNLQRVGQTLLVTTRDGMLRAYDLRTGEPRWTTPRAAIVIPAIANPDAVAVTRCSASSSDCTVEARSISDGAVRWSAPVVIGGAFLGSPGGGEQLQDRERLWPARAVIVRIPPKGVRYEVRELSSGRVITRGSTEDESLGVIGNRFLRVTDDGVVSATDISSSLEVWTRAADGLIPARAESVQSQWLGIPDGGLILVPRVESLPTVSIGDTLRLLDPRTGKATEHPIDLPSGPREVFPGPPPDVTAETANEDAGVAPRVPVLQAVTTGDAPLFIDGRRYDVGDIDFRSIDVTSRQVAWERPMKSFGRGERDGIEVIDRRTGKRLVRYIGDEVRVRSVGERLVIGDGDAEEDQEYVVDG
jgi:hypothetical protein